MPGPVTSYLFRFIGKRAKNITNDKKGEDERTRSQDPLEVPVPDPQM